MTDDIDVTRNDGKSRYDITVDGVLAGFTEFFHDGGPGRLIFPHTEIDPAFGGRGLGTTLVARAMADVAERGEIVIPVCPFVVKYLKEHDVPGLTVEWRSRDREVGEAAPTDEPTPGDEGVGNWRG